MKRLVLIAVAGLILASAGTAQAQVGNGGYQQQRSGPLSRLIELERRKNAWLRRTFLGR